MKFGKHHRLLLILAAAVAATACDSAQIQAPIPERERILEQAFALSESDPARAISLFADAGPGPVLETSRMAVWAACLERATAGPDEWRRLLADQPPESLAIRARLALIRTLVDHGRENDAVSERPFVPLEELPEVDKILFASDDLEIRLAAAGRLVISSPSFLASADRELDRRLASNLSPDGLLERSRSWRLDGQPRRAASDLRRLKWKGEPEKRRRREIARAELGAGSPSRALNILPPARESEAEDHLLRAQALRNRGWHLFPGRGEKRYFADCIISAEAAIAKGDVGDDSQAAYALRLECSSQVGRLSTALESWRLLEAERWNDPRREWLGRRLGVALARSTQDIEAAREMARSLPNHQRCLRYWLAAQSTDIQPDFRALADASIADLYGLWSREALSQPPPTPAKSGPPLNAAAPPKSVGRLLEAGQKSEALRLWRRIRYSRSTFPEEALAASEASAGHGWPTDSIRWLLSGFPELGTVDMDHAPENAIRAYLPLRWSEAIVAAAR